jgi:hypothetical protein
VSGDYTSTQISDGTFTNVALGLAAKVNASAGTLTNGTIAGTLTAAAASVIDLDGAASVVVPSVVYPNNTTAAANTAFVTSGLATKVNASGGTLASGTINGGTTLDGTITASATALLDLDAAGAEVRVPTVLTSDSTTKAASTAFVKAYLPAPGTLGNVPRSNGTDWVTAALAVADVTGAAPLANPVFAGNPQGPTPAIGDSNGSLATTAFVQAALRDATRLAFSGVNERDDFISSTTTSGDLPWSTSANGAGSLIGPANVVPNGAYGYRSFTAGTAATGRAAYTRSELVSTQAALVTPWLAGTITLAWRVQIPTLPAAGVDFPVYSFSLGTGLAVPSDHFVNGIGLRYAVNTNWFLASRSAGADVVAADAGIGPTAGAWQVLVLVISGGSATCYIGSTYAAALAAGVRATISTAGAYASMLSPLMKVNNTAGTTNSRVVLVDTYSLDFNLTTPR